jgi:hypothetical protein
VKTVLLFGEIVLLTAVSFAFVCLGLFLHRTGETLGPLAAALSATLEAATKELEAAKQTTVDVDSGVSYEVAQLKKPTPLALKIAKVALGGLGAFAKL